MFARLGNRSYGVMVSTLDFESSDPGSNPGRTSLFAAACIVHCAWSKEQGSRRQAPNGVWRREVERSGLMV